MRLYIFDTADHVGEWAASHIMKVRCVELARAWRRLAPWPSRVRSLAQRIEDYGPGPGRPFVLGLPTGSTPLPTYRRLVEFHKAGALSFRHVVTFNMDEVGR